MFAEINRIRLLSALVLHFPEACFQFLNLCQGSLTFKVCFCNPFLLPGSLTRGCLYLAVAAHASAERGSALLAKSACRHGLSLGSIKPCSCELLLPFDLFCTCHRPRACPRVICLKLPLQCQGRPVVSPKTFSSLLDLDLGSLVQLVPPGLISKAHAPHQGC